MPFTQEQADIIFKFISNSPTAFDNICVGFEQIDLSGGGVETLNIPDGAKYGLLQAESDAANYALRFRLDGVNPTGTVGFARKDNDTFDILSINDLQSAKFIQASGAMTTCLLNVHYFK